MAYKFKRWRVVLVIVLGSLLYWLSNVALVPTVASDLRLESQINRLESEVGRLRSQVSRIESQLSIPSRSTPPPQIDSSPTGIEPSLEEQFDNLANLAIETKLQVRQLEARVAQLEANPR